LRAGRAENSARLDSRDGFDRDNSRHIRGREILYELREHSAGLNCGRWDYIFSFIKKFRNRPGFTFPDRTQVTMTSPFMRAYCLNVINVCHRRGAHAMGGMAAQIPIKNDPAANEAALAASSPTRNVKPATAMTAPGSRIPASCLSHSKRSINTCRGQIKFPNNATTRT